MRIGIVCVLIVASMGSALSQQTTESKATPLAVGTDSLPKWQRNVWRKVDVYGRFVSEAELDQNPLFQSLSPEGPLIEGDRKEIYLLTTCRPNANPGKRVLKAWASVRINKSYEQEFEIVPRGFLTHGQVYSLVKVVDTDWLLPDGTRKALLNSKPKLTITRLRAK